MSNSSLNNQNQQNSTRRQQQIPGNLQSSQQSLQNNNRSQPLPPQQPQLQIPNPYQSQYSPQPTAQNSFLINNNSSQPLYPQSFAESSSSVNHQQQSMPSYGGSNQIPSNNYYNQNRPTQQQQQFGPNRNNGPSYAYGNQNQNMYGVQAQSSYFQPFPTIGNEAPIYQSAPSHIQPLYISQFMFNPAIELVQQEVPLTEGGNIIVDVKLSSQVLKDARYTDNQEFTHLRYTPLTCSPNDFCEKYTLKAREYKRDIKIAIVCTMYNEDEVLFSKSLGAVFDNVKAFCDYYRDPEWWKHVIVVIVSDGRAKINPRTLTVLAAMGCYADGLIQTAVQSDPATCHMFEYSPQVVVDTDGRIITSSQQKMCPIQTIFLLKEKNGKKINSHRWFFNSICKQLNPEVCMLLDVGTKPTPQSFLRLWRAFEKDGTVGGACGEIAAELGSGCLKVLNPLVAAQNFEYKMSNILDKPLESVFGFISVLPGAFSAYRWKAIQGAPLDAYFKGESLHGTSSVSVANMYLAEDRILCFEIVAKKNENWVLRYVKDAQAETDVPDDLSELISQRRRWLNGSFFAAIHALMNWAKIFNSSHSLARKVMFTFQFVYNWVNLAFTWFSVGNFYLAFSFLLDTSNRGLFGGAGSYISAIAKAIYLFSILTTVVCSLGNRPQGSKWLYMTILIFFAFMMVLMLILSIYAVVTEIQAAIKVVSAPGATISFVSFAWNTPAFRDIVIALGSTYGCYTVSSLIAFDPWHIITSMAWYLLLLPTYVNILMTYSFCNIHDTTWGTKGDNVQVKTSGGKVTTNAEGKQVAALSLPSQKKNDVEEAYGVVLNQLKANALHPIQDTQSRSADQKQEDYFRQFRTNVVLMWIFTNALLIYIFSSDIVLSAMFGGKLPSFNPYLTFLFWSVAVLSLIRFVFSTWYMVTYFKGKMGDLGSRPKKPMATHVV